MTTTRTFDAGDVLSITTGRLVTRGGKYPIDNVADILGFLCGESMMSHQLPRACDMARPHLVALHPETDLEALHGPSVFDGMGRTRESVIIWVDDLVARGVVRASYELEPMEVAGDFSDPIGDFER